MQRPRKRFRYAQNLYVMLQVCSKPIYDAMAKKKLQVQKHLHFEVPKFIHFQIMDISETSAPAEGGKKIIILCERVARDDIKVETTPLENYL